MKTSKREHFAWYIFNVQPAPQDTWCLLGMIIDYLVNLKSILVMLELGMADADFSGVKCLASYLTDVYSFWVRNQESLVSQDSWDGSCFTSRSPFLDCLVENPQISSDLNPIPIHCLVENPQRSSDLNPRTPHPITYQLSAAYIPPDTYCTVNHSDQGHDAGNNDDHNKVLDLFPKAGAKCSHTLKASDKHKKI